MTDRRFVVGVTAPQSLMFFERRIDRLLELGWDVHVIVGEKVPAQLRPDPRVTIHIVPMQRSWSPIGTAWAFLRWLHALGRVRPIHVWSATPKASFLGMLAAKVCGVPVRTFEVWGLRWDGKSGLGSHILRRMDQITALAATRTFAVSPSVASKLLRDKVVAQVPVIIGHGGTKGVDIHRFLPRDHAMDTCLSRPPTVGFLGRLARDKGVGDLIVVAELVRRQIPEAVFILGGEWDEADLPEVEIRRKIRAETSIGVKGYVDDAPTFLQMINVLCFPSHREGLPNAVLEAAACGVPTVGWDVTGTRDAVVSGVTGYLVALGDHKSMANAIVKLLTSVETYSAISVAARDFVVKNFSEQAAMEAFVESVNNACTERSL